MNSPPRTTARRDAFTLVEVLFALGLVAFSFASLFAVFGQGLNLVRGQEETMAATLCLQQRCDQVRTASWPAIVNASRLVQILQAGGMQGAGSLAGLQEDVTVTAYRPAAAGAVPIQLRRLPGGQFQIVTQPADASLSGCLAARVDVRATWQSRGRTRVRESSTVVAMGGITR